MSAFGYRVASTVWAAALAIGTPACSASSSSNDFKSGPTGTGGDTQDASTFLPPDASPATDASSVLDASSNDGSDPCTIPCSYDYKQVLHCGSVVQECEAGTLCSAGVCKPACSAANENRSSVGCEYYPVQMDGYSVSTGGCFAVFLANTSDVEAHVQIRWKGQDLDTSTFGRIPAGTGSNLTYEPFDPAGGIPAGEVGIFFLAGPDMSDNSGASVKCPVAPAVVGLEAQVQGTGVGNAFHVTTDMPVVAYQMLPYGGGSATVTGASLLLPTSAWDTNYIAINAYPKSAVPFQGSLPSMNIIAMHDDTVVSIRPVVPIVGGKGVPAAGANQVMQMTLQRGEQFQVSQDLELTGSPVEASKPIGLMAGHQCLNVPVHKMYCDHAEQQIPPVKALGSEYVAVTHRQRSNVQENPPWRFVGAVDGTALVFDPPVHDPVTIGLGQVFELSTPIPFVVRSQDADHPFLVFAYMTGSMMSTPGYGDSDFVRVTPSGQYMGRYVFFTDPTYPEVNLVVVRTRGGAGFANVELDCAGPIGGWMPVGSEGAYEFARVDLVRHNFANQGNCSNGRHEMRSTEPFGLWIWGWGTPETGQNPQTVNVSYGYPAGENVRPINQVYVPPQPK